MAEQIGERTIARVAHEDNEMRLRELLRETQQRLHRLGSDCSREIDLAIKGDPHGVDIVELATYRITHEVVQCLANLRLESLAEKAAQFAVSREQWERLGVERQRKS